MLFYKHLELLREKNPLLAFLLKDYGNLATRAQEYPEAGEAEVYFLYDVQDPEKFLSLLQKQVDFCFVFHEIENVALFLHSPIAADFLSNPKVALYLVKDEEEQKKIGWRYLFMKRFHLAPLQGEIEGQERVENMLKSIELVASDYREFGVDVLSNVYSNLLTAKNLLFPQTLREKFPQKEVIICGAGASLSLHLDKLKEIQNKVVIVGCGSAIPILMKANIRPHFAAFIDPDPPLEPFEELVGFDMPLLYQNRISKGIFELHKGPKIWMGSSGGYRVENWLLKELQFPDYFLDGGWNVVNFAARALLELGAPSLYFLGVDSSYAKGEIESHEWRIKDLHGEEQVTRKDLFMGAKWIESFAKEHPAVSMKNLGAGGLLIDGVEQVEFKKLQESLSEESFETLIKDTPSYQIDTNRCVELLQVLRQSLLRSKEKIADCLRIKKAGAFALFSVEIEEEIVYDLLLKPLWEIWKPMLLRGEKGMEELHSVLFFQRVVEKHLLCMQVDEIKRFYDDKGTLSSTLSYAKGILHGKVYHYYPDGTVAAEKEFVHGDRVGIHRYFYPGGALSLIEHYQKGLLHGSVRLFSKEGTLLRQSHYKEGKREGSHTIYDKNGQLRESAYFIEDHPAGKHQSFFPSGALQEELEYHNRDYFNKRLFHENGSLLYEGVYDEEMVYTEKRYDPQGQMIIRKRQWVNKEFISV
jgi:antitoxin component YwqK of YwqJK toxin-antitoxin module